jgi:amino acid adenylation domain-containing protein
MGTFLDEVAMNSHRDNNLAARFLEHASATPDHTALRIHGFPISYGDLAARAGRLAAWLVDNVDPENGRVGILAKRTVEAYVGILGTAMAGFAYVPIDPELPLERQLHMIERSKPGVIVCDRPPLIGLWEKAGVRILGPSEAAAIRSRPLEEARPVAPDATAYLMLTSGTGGTPKVVAVTAGNAAHFLSAMRERCPIYPTDQVSQFHELTFDVSVFDIFHGLGSGACLHVVPASQRMAPAAFIRGEGLTVWSSVPSVVGFLERLSQLQPGAFPSLRLTMFCGEPLLASYVEAWRKAAPNSVIENHYGPTEAAVSCLAERVEGSPRVTPSRGVVAIGTPYPGMHAAIVGADGAFLPRGEAGELALSGPQVAAGYFGDEELTERRFRELTHPTLGKAVFYLTGDLAYEDEEGHFHHLGRIDHRVNIQGQRVEMEEIECHIREVSGGETIAVAWPMQDGAPVGVVAFVAGGEWKPGELQNALSERLPSYMVPRQIIRRSSLPVGPNGKLNRMALLDELEHTMSVAAE